MKHAIPETIAVIAVVALTTLHAAPSVGAPDPLIPGSRCTLTMNLTAGTAPKGKGAKIRLKKGSEVEVIKIDGAWAIVKAEDAAAYVKARKLKRVCEPMASEPEPAPGAAAAVPSTPGEPESASAEAGAGDEGNREVEEAQGEPGEVPGATTPTPEGGSPPESSAPKTVSAVNVAPGTAASLAESPPAESSGGSVEETGWAEATRVRVAVMELRGAAGIPDSIMRTLTDAVPSTLDQLGPFDAVGAAEIKRMLAFEVMKQSMGCDDVSCIAEIGGALGAEFIVSGNIALMGDTYLVQMQLMNIRSSKVEERVEREYQGGPKGLLDEVRTATKLMVRDILAAKSGTLFVSVPEEGATIMIDDAIVGVSPMAVQTVAGGMHTITVQKEGFVQFRRDVEIIADRRFEVDAVLLPSEDFKAEYGRQAGLTRTLAWVAMGSGAALVAGSVTIFAVGAAQAGDLQGKIDTYNTQTERLTSEREELLSGRSTLGTMSTLTVVGIGVGVASFTTGLVAYLLGDDPDRYEGDDAPSLEVTPVVGPGAVGIQGRF